MSTGPDVDARRDHARVAAMPVLGWVDVTPPGYTRPNGGTSSCPECACKWAHHDGGGFCSGPCGGNACHGRQFLIRPPAPVYGDDRVQVFAGNAVHIAAALPDQCVDLTFCDPPYSSGGQFRNDRTQTGTAAKYLNDDHADAWQDIEGDSRDQRAYLFWLVMWLTECYRVTRTGRLGMVWTDWRQIGTTIDAMQAAGWIYRGIVPWYKPGARPQLGRPTNACEFVVWGSRGAMPLLEPGSPGAVVIPGLISYTSPRGATKVAPTQKTLAGMRDLVRACPPGGIVLDLFSGSGTTGQAALIEGRRAILSELSDYYARQTADRLGRVRPDTEHTAAAPARLGEDSP